MVITSEYHVDRSNYLMVNTFITFPAPSDRTKLPFPRTLNKTINSGPFCRIPTIVVASLTHPGNPELPQYIQVPVLAS